MMGGHTRLIVMVAPVATIQPATCSFRVEGAKTHQPNEQADTWVLGTSPRMTMMGGHTRLIVMVALRGDHPACNVLVPGRGRENPSTE